MRIVMATETFLPKIDGIVTMITATVECLRARGDEVLLFAPAGGPAELYGARVIGLPSAPFPFYPELRVAAPRAAMRRHIEEFQPDVVHLFEPSLLGIGGIYYAQVLHIPLVISYHTNLPAYLRYYRLGFLQNATWKLMQIRHGRADLNLCTSTPMMEDLAHHNIDRLALWERAVDADRFHPSRRSDEMRRTLSGGEPRKPLLLFVGRLCAEKNIGSLRAVLEAIPDLRLAIVGDGPLRGELEKHFRNTPTHFPGYLRGEALAAAFASSDLFVMPSETETLGLVLMEAMASGCSVVACRAGGIPDAVDDGVTGFLYEPGIESGESSLVETVRRVLANPAERDTVRTRARAEVERHGWLEATDLLRRQYQQAIDHPRPRTQPTGSPGQRSLARRTTMAALRRLLP
ncbi:MAG TPA: glycosyltransferase [Acidobacteriaceae bacterium]|jgi:glycosyltransferase involved in cell wall biosynthesis|nr:glycosyltransferase [Acidobacteriaceae bacterium]